MLVCQILSNTVRKAVVRVETRVLSVTHPAVVLQDASGGDISRTQVINRGQPGFAVVTYRIVEGPAGVRREVVSEDTYPVMNRVVRAL